MPIGHPRRPGRQAGPARRFVWAQATSPEGNRPSRRHVARRAVSPAFRTGKAAASFNGLVLCRTARCVRACGWRAARAERWRFSRRPLPATRDGRPPMPSAPIPAARSQYLLDLLAQVPDPRKKRGRRHPLAGAARRGDRGRDRGLEVVCRDRPVGHRRRPGRAGRPWRGPRPGGRVHVPRCVRRPPMRRACRAPRRARQSAAECGALTRFHRRHQSTDHRLHQMERLDDAIAAVDVDLAGMRSTG